MRIGIADLVDGYALTNSIPKAGAKKIILSVLDLIKNNLVEGNDIIIRKNFSLSVVDVPVREGYNPSLGRRETFPAKKKFRFKASNEWISEINAPKS